MTILAGRDPAAGFIAGELRGEDARDRVVFAVQPFAVGPFDRGHDVRREIGSRQIESIGHVIALAVLLKGWIADVMTRPAKGGLAMKL